MTQTFESNGQQVSASVEAEGNEKHITCQFQLGPNSPMRTVESIWVDGKGWEDDALGAWSPILEGLFDLK